MICSYKESIGGQKIIYFQNEFALQDLNFVETFRRVYISYITQIRSGIYDVSRVKLRPTHSVSPYIYRVRATKYKPFDRRLKQLLSLLLITNQYILIHTVVMRTYSILARSLQADVVFTVSAHCTRTMRDPHHDRIITIINLLCSKRVLKYASIIV